MLNDDPAVTLRHTATMALYLFLQLDGPALWVGPDYAVAIGASQAIFVLLDEDGLHHYHYAKSVQSAVGDAEQHVEVFEYD